MPAVVCRSLAAHVGLDRHVFHQAKLGQPPTLGRGLVVVKPAPRSQKFLDRQNSK